MVKKKPILNLLLTFLVIAFFHSLQAQQQRIDSLIRLLEKSQTEKGVDTVAFDNALINLLLIPQLSEREIAQLEKAGSKFNNGTDEYWSYLLRLRIFNNLVRLSIEKAVPYGRYQVDQLEKSKTTNTPKIRDYFLGELRLPYRNSSRLAEGFQFYTDKLKEYKVKNDSSGLAVCYFVLAGFYNTTGLFDQAIYNMKMSTTYVDTLARANRPIVSKWNGLDQWVVNNIGLSSYYFNKEDYKQCIKYGTMVLRRDVQGNRDFATNYLAKANLLVGQLDSVEYLLDRVIENNNPGNGTVDCELIIIALQTRVLLKIKTGDLDETEKMLMRCRELIDKYRITANSTAGIVAPDYYLALVRIEQNRITDAIALLTKDIERVKYIRQAKLKDYKLLAELYEKVGDSKNSKEGYKSFISLQDSLLADQAKFGNISFETEQEMSEKELSITKLQNENKISSLTRNFTIGMTALLLILAVGLYSRYRFKQKANLALEKTLSELKSTQTQLIQSEKMASLGELTAGIAHEIQNPLNFVNNFSEVNTELIDELELEVGKGNLEEAKALANDIRENEQKINHHGKRADAIVKGMLQHSRSSSGVKEPTDINALCDEYLRLCYHGLRAKDKSFNATMKTDFDASLGKLNVIPQDLGRVILNLLTNAFYAVTEKKKQVGGDYEPTVFIATKRVRDKVEIRVRDNGNGIPQKILDKIFQPFFTTKPTGQGTGLGLSLSYDIVTKGHGGELKVETREGQGAEFIIILPV